MTKIPDKWGNYHNCNTGMCLCGHDAMYHASTIGICIQEKCMCNRFSPVPAPKYIPDIPKERNMVVKRVKKVHGRNDHKTVREYFACAICMKNIKKEE